MIPKSASKLAALALCALILLALCSACASPPQGALALRFNEDFDTDKYDGREVTMRGYMSTLSPLDGRFFYLMNLPYQVCPFCLPNTMTVVNTVTVYAPQGDRFGFDDRPIEVTGTFKAGEFTDEFGYQYPFVIENATYKVADTNEMSENMKMYGSLAQDGIILEVMALSIRVDQNAFFGLLGLTENDIVKIDDAEFDALIRRVEAISKSAYTEFTDIIKDFKAFNKDVNAHIDIRDYAYNTSAEMEEQYFLLVDRLNAWLIKFEV
ncbi:MAG: hypothetical protein LBR85_01305 [Oscillospiraceae bacterium]|jgi:hypothetical protein|nr:hypothetical protein [Oscillospiraceae bacterium]